MVAARGHAASAMEGRRREQLYEQLCADVMREMQSGRAALARAAARALNHPQVQGDPELGAMIRGYIAQREAELRQIELERAAEENGGGGQAPAPAPSAVVSARLSEAQAGRMLARLMREFHEPLGRFDEGGARALLDRLRRIREQCPRALDEGAIEQCVRQFERMCERRRRFQAHAERVARHAVAAVRRGDHDAAARLLRRLSMIHAARPQLLSGERLERFREWIASAGEQREHREAARRLVERCRAVSAEVRGLVEAVERFHRVARSAAADDEAFRAAEAAYRRAIREVRTHDEEWLAGLILELSELLEQWHDASGKGEMGVDRFVRSIRGALGRLRREIVEVERERAARAGA